MSVYCIIISKNMYYKRGRAVSSGAETIFQKGSRPLSKGGGRWVPDS